MPVTLKLTFPAGRYHATPWGRHVNEGVPEWPPSPWRLLRALVAVWRRTRPDLSEHQVRRVLEQLVKPPLFQLPQAAVAHTRHYMPWEKKGPANRTLVFDTFVAVSRSDRLLLHWKDAELSPADSITLGELVGNLTTLGRAEGWVEAEVVDEAPGPWSCKPESDLTGDERSGRYEPIPVLCPDPVSVFGGEHYPPPPAKKRNQGLKPDELLFDCPRWHLCLDTQTIHAERWPHVPGAKWETYARLPEPGPRAVPASRPPSRPEPTVARFLLDGPVLPLVTDTVRVAEAFRQAAMSQFKRWCERRSQTAPETVRAFRRTDQPDLFSSPVLSGKGRGGEMARSHEHAYYLPSADRDDPRRVSHVTVYARGGLGAAEVAALTAIREVHLLLSADRSLDLRVQLVGLGQPRDFRAAQFGPHRVWRSATPFVGPAHIGRSGRDRYLLKAARREARRWAQRWAEDHGGPTPIVLVEPLDDEDSETIHLPRPHTFRRSRIRDGGGGYQRPCGLFRLHFETEVTGPICIGYASHFGLGLFVAEADTGGEDAVDNSPRRPDVRVQ